MGDAATPAVEDALALRADAKHAARNVLPERVADGVVLLGYRGSVAHGTYDPSDDGGLDDVDLMGVHVLPLTHYLGQRRKRQETVERGPDGEDDPWDVVSYEVRHYVDLCRKANPNVLQLLWLPDDLMLYRSRVGQMLVAARDVFATKAALPAFLGYARSQRGRLERASAPDGKGAGYMGERRRRLVEQHGYDVKYAAHLVRLLEQGREFLATGAMRMPRPEASVLRAIKGGSWTLEEVLDRARHLERELERAAEDSDLPEEPDAERVEALQVVCVAEHHGFRRDQPAVRRAMATLWGRPDRNPGVLRARETGGCEECP